MYTYVQYHSCLPMQVNCNMLCLHDLCVDTVYIPVYRKGSADNWPYLAGRTVFEVVHYNLVAVMGSLEQRLFGRTHRFQYGSQYFYDQVVWYQVPYVDGMGLVQKLVVPTYVLLV